MLHRHERIALPGVVHFVTTVTRVRGLWFVDEELCTKLLKLFEQCRARHHLDCLGFVLMPDHLHAILHHADSGTAVYDFMESFKKSSSRYLRPRQFGETPLWRRGHDDVALPGRNAIVRRLHYMHNNPVRRGIMRVATEYRWSSAREILNDEKGIVTLTRLE